MHSVFSTLTYPRDKNIRDTWLNLNLTANRYVQRVRRTLDSCEYLKTYEIHKDGYPHIHILFIFSNLNYPYNNTRWLPDDVFKKLKSAWTHGLSDHQSPTSLSGHSTLNYVLKYISKTSSSRHLWTRILTPDTNYTTPTNVDGYPIRPQRYSSYYTLLVPTARFLDRTDCRIQKIKLLTWSRNFIKSYLSTLQNIKPCPNPPNLHTPNPSPIFSYHL